MARDLVETILNLVFSILNFSDSACKRNDGFSRMICKQEVSGSSRDWSIPMKLPFVLF